MFEAWKSMFASAVQIGVGSRPSAPCVNGRVGQAPGLGAVSQTFEPAWRVPACWRKQWAGDRNGSRAQGYSNQGLQK